MKILHIMDDDKFTSSYIDFINKYFDERNHQFYIFSEVFYKEIIFEKNIKVLKIIEKNKIIKKIKYIKAFLEIFIPLIKYDKIILHNLFNPLIIIFLFFNPWFLKKCNWVIWGADLYSYKNRNFNSLKRKIYYKIEDFVKKNIGGYITHIKGDYELAKEWYGVEGKYYDCFMYLSNVYKELEVPSIKKECINIQIGNSADPSNNQKEIIDKLSKFKDENIKLYCILSYGNKKWAEEVTRYGKEIFGDKFTSITEFMQFNEYIKFISEIDIAIFAHDRQQAAGNITSLLGMGKTVYLKESVTTYSLLKELEIEVKIFENFKNLDFISEKERKKNSEIIKERFSEKRLKEDLKKIFDE